MFVRWLELKGQLETLEEINEAFMEETGSTEPWQDSEDDCDNWKAWIEHAHGNTYILAEEEGRSAEECNERYGKIGS